MTKKSENKGDGLNMQNWFTGENIIKNVPYIFLICVLGIVYIANSHYHLKLERKIDKKEKQMQRLSWEYMTTKSDVMFSSKQSEVAKAVEHMGLKPLVEPPKIIVIEK